MNSRIPVEKKMRFSDPKRDTVCCRKRKRLKASLIYVLLLPFAQSLSHRFDVRAGEDNSLKETRLLERCRATLEARYAALLRRQPKQVKGTKENGVLLATINKLRKEVTINRAKYEERLSLVEGSSQSNAKDKLESTE